MKKETILEELEFTLRLLKQTTTLDDIKCAKFNLSYSIDTTLDENLYVFDNISLPIVRSEEDEEEFFAKLDTVTSCLNIDPLWDCSGTVWMKDGSWLELIVPSEWATHMSFRYNYPPDIPIELFYF